MAADAVIGAVVVGAGTAMAAWFTRRTAKEGNAVTGFKDLMEAQQAELERLAAERARDSGRIASLERDRERTRQLALAHEGWDWRIKRTCEELSGETFPDPPPLYVFGDTGL